ncbi:MAG TPA: response regulator [Steroidobacteraceae bacterium]|nr:response regulator [Steroidobacteraceae bacterium]
MSSPPARVYVVDDDTDQRDGLAQSLAEAGYEPKGFCSGMELLESFPRLVPGCIIADMVMPEMSGIELQRRLLSLGCRWPVIMLTGQASKPLVTRAMEAGIVAFLEKPVRQIELLAAVIRGQALLAGKTEPAIDPRLVQRLNKLTRRERQVLDYVLKDKLNKQIAAILGIGETTVKSYRSALLKKLGVHTTLELVVFSLRAGLLVVPKS